MKTYTIKLMGGGGEEGDQIQITEEEFNNLKGKSGPVYIPSINEIVNLNRIERVYADSGESVEFLKLPEPKKEMTSVREGMSNLFNSLKAKGLFKNYASYEAWEKERGKEKGIMKNVIGDNST